MRTLQQVISAADWSGTVVALALIAADVSLHLAGKPAGPYDEAVPVIVALYLGGHIAVRAQNGKPPSPP